MNRVNLNQFPGIKFIIVCNIFVFLIIQTFVSQSFIYNSLSLQSYESFQLWQPMTYLFLHGSFWHLFVNMFMLWMFGRSLQSKWGISRFVKYYFFIGIGSGLLTIFYHFIIGTSCRLIGASGAVYGVIVAYALMHPNRKVYLFGILEIKVKFMMLIFVLSDFIGLFSSSSSNVSYITHISGLFLGIILLARKQIVASFNLWRINFKIKRLLNNEDDLSTSNEILIYRANMILEKLSDKSWDELTSEEERVLKDVSDKFFDSNRPN